MAHETPPRTSSTILSLKAIGPVVIETTLYWDTEHSDLAILKSFRANPLAEGHADATTAEPLTSSPDASLASFARVGEKLAGLKADGLLCVRQCGLRSGSPFWVMAREQGSPLAAILAAEGNGPSRVELGRLLAQLLDALAVVHEAGLLHRDIKPSNILLGPDGLPVLIDFDAAALITGVGASLSLHDMSSLITPGYAAPEQYLKQGQEGPWTDLYGLAAVAWHVVAGVVPDDAYHRLRDDRLTPAAELGRGRYSDHLLRSIDHALSVEPSGRPQSAREWRDALGPLTVLAPTAAVGQNEDRYSDTPQHHTFLSESLPAWVDDDGPPTVRIARRALPVPAIDPEPIKNLSNDTDENDADHVPRKKRVWPMAAAAICVATILAGVWTVGWDYYLANIKNEWIVDQSGDGDVRSMAEALSRAKPGALITVRPGTYTETLIVNQPRSIVGDGDASKIVVAPNAGQPCLVSSAPGVMVKGMSFRTTDITAHSTSAVPCFQVPLGHATLEASQITAAGGPGLEVSRNATAKVHGNDFRGKGPAVVISSTSDVHIHGNTMTTTDMSAVVLLAGEAVRVSENRIIGTGGAGVLIIGGTATVEQNHISDTAHSAIEIRDEANPVLKGNVVEGAGQAGLFVHNGGRGTITGTTITGSRLSAVVVADGIPLIRNNALKNSDEFGVLLLENSAGRIESNIITNNSGNGIAKSTESMTIISDNVIENNLEPQIKIGQILTKNDTPDTTNEAPITKSSDRDS